MTEKIMEEYKITCQGCGSVRFTPYFKFTKHTTKQKPRGFLGDLIFSLGLSTACLPLGRCTSIMAFDDIAVRNKSPEEKLEKYFDLQKVNVCGKCKSLAKKVEVITHDLNDVDG